MVGGLALYVAGNLSFKQTLTGRWPLSHLVGLGLLALVALLSLAGALALIVAAAREMRFSPRDHVEA